MQKADAPNSKDNSEISVKMPSEVLYTLEEFNNGGLHGKNELTAPGRRRSASASNLFDSLDHGNEKLKSVSIHQRALNLACALDTLDASLLPGVFRALEIHLKVTPIDLGKLALVQALMSKIATPFWGVLCEIYPDRMQILSIACFFWGMFTIGIGLSNSFFTIAVFRGLNGIALAVINPLSQSIISDMFTDGERGKAFGWTQYYTSLGTLIGGLFSTTVSNMIFFGGAVLGWRIPFLSVGCFSICFAFYMYMFVREPIRRCDKASFDNFFKNNLVDTVREEVDFGGLKDLFKVNSLRVVIFQGLFGAIPWNAFQFIAFWLQYIGFSDFQSGVIKAMFTLGGVFGSLVGGYLGDYASKINDYHGRTYVAQFSVFSGIPIVFFIMKVLPSLTGMSNENNVDQYLDTTWAFLAFSFTFLIFGLSISWCGVCLNRPVFAEMAPTNLRGLAFSLLIAFEGSTAALFGAPLVGYLSEHVFNYQASNTPIVDMAEDFKIQNAYAVSNSILAISLVGWGVCGLFYSSLHWFYPNDKKALQGNVLYHRVNNYDVGFNGV